MTLLHLERSHQFLFGQYDDHEKFLNSDLTGGEHGGLFVSILERAVSDSSPQKDETEFVNKVDPVRLAKGHIQLKEFQGRDYNIYEAAYLRANETGMVACLNKGQVAASISAIVLFFGVILTEVVTSFSSDEFSVWTEDSSSGEEKQWILILLINFVSLAYLWLLIGNYRDSTHTFNKAVRLSENNGRLQAFYLFMNYFSNVTMGWLLYILNFFFIQTADTPTDAILNAVATSFILEIDDAVRPWIFVPPEKRHSVWPYQMDWGLGSMDGKLAEMVYDYVTEETAKSEKVNVCVSKTKGEDVVFQETDVCFFFVNVETGMIRIYRADCSGTKTGGDDKHIRTFELVEYKVEGNNAKNFLENLSEFDCAQEDKGEVELEGGVLKKILKKTE